MEFLRSEQILPLRVSIPQPLPVEGFTAGAAILQLARPLQTTRLEEDELFCPLHSLHPDFLHWQRSQPPALQIALLLGTWSSFEQTPMLDQLDFSPPRFRVIHNLRRLP